MFLNWAPPPPSLSAPGPHDKVRGSCRNHTLNARCRHNFFFSAPRLVSWLQLLHVMRNVHINIAREIKKNANLVTQTKIANMRKKKGTRSNNYRDLDMRLGGAIHAHSYHVDCSHASRTVRRTQNLTGKIITTTQRPIIKASRAGSVSTEGRSGCSGPAFGNIRFMGHNKYYFGQPTKYMHGTF